MGKRAKSDPQKLMEKAVEVMKHSIHERRTDSKPLLWVGAVLVKPDGTIETGCRGEVRLGDHAEYTLLERKNLNALLDGSILYTTLEPCAPGARKHPKLGCAERIVNARIKEVWVGIEDPDPTVDRKGIKYLEDHGIRVYMFDRDYQERIREQNAEWIKDALRRAEEAVLETKPTQLSRLESALPLADMRLLSNSALDQFREVANIDDPIESDAFKARLQRMGVLRLENNALVPTGYGILLFGVRPRDSVHQAGLMATIYGSDGVDKLREFDGPMVLIPDQLEEWILDRIPSTIDRSRMKRVETGKRSFELVREAVINALVHRDYDIEGAKCQLTLKDGVVTVLSPGRPVSPIRLEQLQAFTAPMLSRNPMLHYVFSQMEMGEERGFGMTSFRDLPPELGLPLPKYSFRDPYLELSIYLTPDAVASSLSPEVREQLNSEELQGWTFLTKRISIRQAEYSEFMGIDKRKAQRHLTKFVQLGLLRRSGSGPATEYHVQRR